MIKSMIEETLRDINLKDVKVKCEYNSRYAKVVASVSRTLYDNFYIMQYGDYFLKLDEQSQRKIIQHEMAHIYDRRINKRSSKHDKIFKDLCEGLYGDRLLGSATTKKLNLKFKGE